MNKFQLTRIVTSAVVALGLLFGLLPPGLPKASANVADYTFTNNTGRTVRDLHIDFNRIGHLVPDDGPWGPFSSGEPGKDDSATNRMHLWDGQVPPGGTATIRVSLEGNGDWTRFAWTFNGEKPRNWINNPDVRNTQALISRALTATKNDQLRARLSALGPGSVGDINFVIEKNVPRELAKLAESAKEMRDPSATALAEAVALLNKVIVVIERDGFQGTRPPEASAVEVQPSLVVPQTPQARDPVANAIPAPAPSTTVPAIPPLGSATQIEPLSPARSMVPDLKPGTINLKGRQTKVIYHSGATGAALTYRIRNDANSGQDVNVIVDGKLVATLEPGDSTDVSGKNIQVQGTQDRTQAAVQYERVP